MRNRFAAYAVAATLLLAVPLAYAAGLFPGFPVVGGAAYCNGTSTGATGTQVCTVTVPAGPTIVTGLERVPADTQIAGGGQPQTVSLTMASLNALPYTFTNVANAGTITATNTTGILIISPNAGATTATVVLPPSAIDGQQIRVTANSTMTVTMSPVAGQSVNTSSLVISAPAGQAVGNGGSGLYLYRLGATQWTRI